MNQLATATTTITWNLNPTQNQNGNGQGGNSNGNSNSQGATSTQQSSTTPFQFPIYAIALLSVAGLVITLGVIGGLVFGGLKLVWFMQTSGSTAATVGSSAPLTQNAV